MREHFNMLGAIQRESSQSRGFLGAYKDLKRPQGMGKEPRLQEALLFSPGEHRKWDGGEGSPSSTEEKKVGRWSLNHLESKRSRVQGPPDPLSELDGNETGTRKGRLLYEVVSEALGSAVNGGP